MNHKVNTKAAMSISRTQSNREEDRVRIIIASGSGAKRNVIEIDISLEEYARMITGLLINVELKISGSFGEVVKDDE